jgi:hypothetical protein
MNHSADPGEQTQTQVLSSAICHPSSVSVGAQGIPAGLYENCKNFAKISKKSVTNWLFMCL